MGELSQSIINTSEILCVHRDLVEVTDVNRDFFRGLITPYGKAYVISVVMKDGRRFTCKCVNEEYQTKMFSKLNATLGTHVIEYPDGMLEAARNMMGGQH